MKEFQRVGYAGTRKMGANKQINLPLASQTTQEVTRTKGWGCAGDSGGPFLDNDDTSKVMAVYVSARPIASSNLKVLTPEHASLVATKYYVTDGTGSAVKLTQNRIRRIGLMMKTDQSANYAKVNPVFPAPAHFADFAREYIMYEEAADNLEMAKDSFLRAERLLRSVMVRSARRKR